MQNVHGKLRQKSAYVSAKSWRPVALNNILYKLYTSWINKNSQFPIKNMHFVLKMVLGWILGHPVYSTCNYLRNLEYSKRYFFIHIAESIDNFLELSECWGIKGCVFLYEEKSVESRISYTVKNEKNVW